MQPPCAFAETVTASNMAMPVSKSEEFFMIEPQWETIVPILGCQLPYFIKLEPAKTNRCSTPNLKVQSLTRMRPTDDRRFSG